ncbi:uncharacterized protein LOC100205249 isoform X3 [Hydra vulgaris]|uniref:uncharacterized protein LOC100205249 isoform X3 n=1 Tax=Hydra vulgaris TaxID=6087 RepID=UPI0032EA0E4B
MKLVLCVALYFVISNVVSSNVDSNIHLFNEKLEEVINLMLDKENNQIIFSTLNILYAVSLDLKIIKKQSMPNDPDPLKTDRVTSMISDSNLLITCASNKYYSRCWRFNKFNLTLDSAWSDYGEKLAPAYKSGELNKMILTKPFIFSTGMHSASSAISKFKYPDVDDSDTARIKTVPSQISVGTTFISTYEFDDSQYIYFFFKEVMKLDSREIYMSNVARICKYDEGGPITSSASAQFVTFLKSRLVCKKEVLNGNKKVTFYYDQLAFSYEVTLTSIDNKSEKYIYAIFTESRETGTISAFCRYQVTEIVKTFTTSSLKDKSGYKEEMKPLRSELSRGKCKSNLDVPQDSEFLHKTANGDLYDQVESLSFFSLNNVSLTTMVIGVDKSSHYILAGAENGNVYKINVNNNEVSLSPAIVNPFDSSKSILSLILLNNTLYVGGVSGFAMFDISLFEKAFTESYPATTSSTTLPTTTTTTTASESTSSEEATTTTRSNPTPESNTPLPTTTTTVGLTNTKDVTAVSGTGENQKKSFFSAFVLMLVLFIIALFTIIMLLIVAWSYRRKRKHGVSDLDGANGSLPKYSLRFHYNKKSKRNNDSTNTGLLKNSSVTDDDYKHSLTVDESKVGNNVTNKSA